MKCKLSRICRHGGALVLALLLAVLPLISESKNTTTPASWTLAAAPFTGDSDLVELLPSLILSSLPDNLVRTIDGQEQYDRQVEAVSKELPSLVSNLNSLITKRDSVVLSSASQREKEQTIRNFEEEIALARQKVEDCRSLAALNGFTPEENLREPVALYQNSATALCTGPAEDAGIQALIEGFIVERGNYLFASVTVSRFPGNRTIGSCDSVYPKTSANLMAEDIVQKLINVLVNKEPVTINLQITGTNSKTVVRMDGVPLVNPSQPVTTQAGIHHFTVESDGCETQGFTYDFSEAAAYQVQVRMIPSQKLNLSVQSITDRSLLQKLLSSSTPEPVDSTVYLMGGMGFASSQTITVNGLPVMGELVSAEGISTYFLVQPSAVHSDRNAALSAAVPLHTASTTQRIDASRRSMYTSFGLFLLTLPVSFACYGRMGDYAAQIDGRYGLLVPQDSRFLWEGYERWRRRTLISMGVSGVFAANWIYRLSRYIIAANQVLPEIVYPEEIE